MFLYKGGGSARVGRVIQCPRLCGRDTGCFSSPYSGWPQVILTGRMTYSFFPVRLTQTKRTRDFSHAYLELHQYKIIRAQGQVPHPQFGDESHVNQGQTVPKSTCWLNHSYLHQVMAIYCLEAHKSLLKQGTLGRLHRHGTFCLNSVALLVISDWQIFGIKSQLLHSTFEHSYWASVPHL